MAVFDLNTFTEVDPNNHLSISANYTGNFVGLDRDEDAYFYYAPGVNLYSGPFKFHFRIYIVKTSSFINSYCFPFTLSNVLDDAYYLSQNEDFIGVKLYYDSGASDILLSTFECYDGTTNASGTYTLADTTIYYCELERTESVGYGTLTLRIYSDIGYTNLLDTLSVSLHKRVNFNYIMAAQSYNIGTLGGDTMTGYVSYIDEISRSVGNDFPNIKTINETDIVNIKSINGITNIDANIKSINGIT
jgi:hypothetical protein